MAPGPLEHVDRRGGLHLGQQRVGGRHERGVLQALAVLVGDAVQAPQVERAGEPEHLLVAHAELGDQQVEHALGHRLLDLEPDRRAEPAPEQLLLERREEVLRVVLLDLEVLVAGHPERVDLEHLHAREQPLEVLADDVLQRDEPLVAEWHEPVEDRRHLDPGEVLLAGLGVADRDGQVERESGDVGERVRRVDRERGEDGEDPVLEQLLAVLLLLAVEVAPPHELDAGVEERGHQLVGEQPRVLLAQHAGLVPDRLEHLAGQQPRSRLDRQPRGDPALEAGHPDHEELVEVAGEDRREPDAFEQRLLLVLGQLEHPLVEAEPGQLTVEEPVLELLDPGERGLGRDVRRLDVEGLLRHAVATSRDGGVGAVEGHGGKCGTAG